jgi:hypothetical protein
MGVGDEKPAKAVFVAENPADFLEVYGPHEGDAGIEEGRRFGRDEVGRQIDVRQRVETLDDLAGFFDDHDLCTPSKPVGMLEEGLRNVKQFRDSFVDGHKPDVLLKRRHQAPGTGRQE